MNNGLKDHQIQELTNALRDAVDDYVEVNWIREVIFRTIIEYLEKNNLRIDKKK